MTHAKPILIILGGIAMATAAGPALDAQETVLHVAPDGDDGWSGALAAPNAGRTDGPLASLAGARDAVRRLRAETGEARRAVTVLLRGGMYALDEPVAFTPEDSGTPEAPVTYAAFEGETPVISGGRVITGWQEGEDGVWTVHLPEVQAGEWFFRQLFVKQAGEAHFMRRYRPNLGPFIIAGLTDAPAREGMGHRRSQDEFRFVPGDFAEWENRDDVEVVALHDWSSSRLRIRELDLEENIVRFTGFPVYRIGHWWRHGRNPYYVENVKEAFGEAGEWYLDRPTGVLSYRPVEGEDMTTAVVVAPRTGQLARFTGDAETGLWAEHIHLRGLTFAHTHWALPEEGYSSGQGMTDLPAAVEARQSRDLRIEGCTFAHLGAYAVDLGGGCRDNEIVGNRMFDLGGGGVKVGGGPTPVNNLVANNVISDGGLVHFSAHGIWSGITQRTIIRHNVVRRFLYSNVSIGWAWHDRPTDCRENTIEYNHIHDAMMLLADGGGIYSLGFQPGTVIRGNHIHDVHRSIFAGSAPNNGIFFDQGSKEFLVAENVIYNTAPGAVVRFNQCAEDWHTWEGNVFDVTPEDPDFPADLAARAGLEPAFAHLDAEEIPVAPAPILSMTLPPPPPPPPIRDDFERAQVGAGPAQGSVQGADERVHIRVTDETAARGNQSLKFTDGPGAARPFYPYLIYQPGFDRGRVTVGFYLRLEAGCRVGVDLRDYFAGGFANGVSLGFDDAGNVRAGDRRLATVPVGEWFRVVIRLGVGPDNTGEYSVSITPPDGETIEAADLPLADERFEVLDWVGIISHGTEEAVFYVDEVEIAYE